MTEEYRKEIIIRDFSIRDYEELIEMWVESGLSFKPEGRDSREKIGKELEGGAGSLLIAEMGGKIAGSVLVTHDGRKGWINRLAVLPELRGKGIGGKLASEAQKKLDEAGIEITASLIEEDNTDSILFFRKLGFKRHDGIIYFTRRKHPGV